MKAHGSAPHSYHPSAVLHLDIASQSPVTTAPTQEALRAPKRTPWEKVDDVLTTYGFASLGNFLAVLFYHRPTDDNDPRTSRHKAAVTSFLQGSNKFKMGHLITPIYDHPQPDQVAAAFPSHLPLSSILYPRTYLSAWATRIIGDETYRRIGRLAKKSDDPDSRTHVQATTNGRKEGAKVATWEHMEFTMQGLADHYRDADDFIWYLTECFCAPRVKGKVVICKRRPHPAVCSHSYAVISNLIVCLFLKIQVSAIS